MIKVMVVDDSVFMRKMITKMLEKEKDIEVIATARNGKEAIDLNIKLKPDVITLDIEMPQINGLEALKEIMSTRPTKVIMLSSLTIEGAKETIKSLELGAFDFLSKPDGKSISLNIEKVEESKTVIQVNTTGSGERPAGKMGGEGKTGRVCVWAWTVKCVWA